MRSSDLYQLVLIFLGILATLFFGVFVYREAFPEYKVYQQDYVALEKFRSELTGEPPPVFQYGVKQIVFEREDKGPARVDRCTSCHVALQIADFSPTKIERDLNGNIVTDANGIPLKAPNENYIWKKLDDKVAELTDSAVNKQLEEEGQWGKVQHRMSLARDYDALKTAHVGEHIYDVRKVLIAHPLIGRETRPFEFHPIAEYGCTVCHNGNGLGLTTQKAHGPVFDDQYEHEFIGPKPVFLESDEENDPRFSQVFNHKPGEELIFQTNPLYVGGLMQAKCVQCHQPLQDIFGMSAAEKEKVKEGRLQVVRAAKDALGDQKNEIVSLLLVRRQIQTLGLQKTLEALQTKAQDYTLPQREIDRYASQVEYLNKLSGKESDKVGKELQDQIAEILGSEGYAEQLEQSISGKTVSRELVLEQVNAFLEKHRGDQEATGPIFLKLDLAALDKDLTVHAEEALEGKSGRNLSAVLTDTDRLTQNFRRGQMQYISQACYACHKIAGFSRGGVGPELTKEGLTYPWFIKESIVWPQADLKTSTMPNFILDHEEVEDLVTYLLGQTGPGKLETDTAYKIRVKEWEEKQKLSWEKPVPPSDILDLRYSMTVFATEGCAACHRLKGFESDVGFQVEKDGSANFAALEKEREWFQRTIPEEVRGTELVEILEKNGEEIDRRIAENVRNGSILEAIDKKIPGQVESLNTPFKFAMRAKNHHYKTLSEKDPVQKAEYDSELKAWKDRVRRVLMMYVQEYGLGRLIGPRPNWSGIFRTDEWLMEHFKKPTVHVPRSIMPVFPFDETKFFALTHMLDTLGIRNRDGVREVWNQKGFNPEKAYGIFCSQCHGDFRLGNGPVSEWIYPVPKNLRSADFLRNLTRERVVYSLKHGVKGTPMPPWGELASDKPHLKTPVLTEEEIQMLTDWLFSSLPGGKIYKQPGEVKKWQYGPEEILEEMYQERDTLPSIPTKKNKGPLSSLTPILGQINPYTTVRKLPARQLAVDEVFDVIPDPTLGPDEHLYYIKKKYYTKENLEKGKDFFELNCAVCHGREGDGQGNRAEAMQDAKPRMLTNIDWSESRDDLRFLRSIKYGVPGTGMTAWGDLTSSLQRMQLVMYIRSLSEPSRLRESIMEALYKAFETSRSAVDRARAADYPVVARLQKEYQEVQWKRDKLYKRVGNHQNSLEESVDMYQRELELKAELRKVEKLDEILVEIKKYLATEKEIYQNIGLQLLAIPSMDDRDLKLYLSLLQLNEGRVLFTEDRLIVKKQESQEMDAISKELLDRMAGRIKNIDGQLVIIRGKILSPEVKEELEQLSASKNTLVKLEIAMISGFEEASRLRSKEFGLYGEYMEKRGDLNEVKKDSETEKAA